MLPSAPHPTPTLWSPRRARTLHAEPTATVRTENRSSRAGLAGLASADGRIRALRATSRSLAGKESTERSAVREQLDAYTSHTALRSTLTHTRRGVNVNDAAPLGVVAFICEPSCPTLLLTEHLIAALTAGNAIAVALLEPAAALFSEVLDALQLSHPGALAVVSAVTGNDWSGVPDCTVIVLTRTRIHVNGTGSHLVRTEPSTPASRRGLIRLYSTTTRYTVGIDLETGTPQPATPVQEPARTGPESVGVRTVPEFSFIA